MPLKYTFTATFADGRVLKQTLEDRSELDPEKRNAYYDLLEHKKGSRVVRFEIAGAGNTYAVDLTDGHFEVNGVPFAMRQIEDLTIDPMAAQGVDLRNREFELVFFMNNTRSFATQASPGGGVEPQYEIEHIRLWCFGWRCNIAGRNYQEIMQIA